MSIPVQRLSAGAREAYRVHLLALPAEDTRLRFGSPLSEEGIGAYVAGIDFDSDQVFGVHDAALALVGAAHLAVTGELAELGVSVLPDARGRGIGFALVSRAAEYARNRHTQRLLMHCLAENAAMIHIARRAGMEVVIEAGDADAQLALPPANVQSVTNELVAERIALFDYTLKSQVETWRRVGVAMMGRSSS